MKLARMSLKINGVERFVLCDSEEDSLAVALRRMGLTGVKIGCGTGVCGACSVLLNGEVVRACTKKMKRVTEFSEVLTIEGIGTPQHLHPLQQAWITYGGAQCGFCSPGSIVSAYGLLAENASPTREDVRKWFKDHHNICRCTGYKPLVDACGRQGHARREDHGRHHLRLRGRDRDLRIAAPAADRACQGHRSRPTTATMSSCRCRRASLTWRWCSPKCITPTSSASTPVKPRRCRASSR